MKLQIRHRTRYSYTKQVAFGQHQLMFRPRENHSIQLESFLLKISPAYRLRWIRDLYENNIAILELFEPASELVIESESVVAIREENPFDFVIASEGREYPFLYDHEVHSELLPLTVGIYSRDTDRIRSWLDPYWHPGRRVGTLDLLQELNKVIYRDITYQRRERKGVQSPAETLEKNSGSCRDFATLFLEACRFLGLASRFVSGYMYSSEITGRMSMHSWAETYLPGAGWIGFDPSWGILADSQYVPVAVTRHPEHAPPISGTYFGTPRDFMGADIHLYVDKSREVAMTDQAFTGQPSEAASSFDRVVPFKP